MTLASDSTDIIVCIPLFDSRDKLDPARNETRTQTHILIQTPDTMSGSVNVKRYVAVKPTLPLTEQGRAWRELAIAQSIVFVFVFLFIFFAG